MDRYRVSAEDFRRTVLAYHGLPVLTAFALVGIFVAGFFYWECFLVWCGGYHPLRIPRMALDSRRKAN
jgi:hypothetical protein